ncbi:MAG TPA: hypothetical protein VFF22_21240 [Pseudomonas sp.]|nr:hypothetical protein [Pseudomonas sp.]
MSQLPEPVLQAMQRGEHDQAIRMLSLNQGITQEAAQEQMNLYLEENPPIRLRGAGIVGQSRTNALIWLGLIVLMAVAYLLLAN